MPSINNNIEITLVLVTTRGMHNYQRWWIHKSKDLAYAVDDFNDRMLYGVAKGKADLELTKLNAMESMLSEES